MMMMMMMFTVMLVLVLVMMMSSAATSMSSSSSSPSPHILFIVIDDLGFDDVGFRATSKLNIQTPNIDALAKEGLILDRYYLQDVCSPSRASIMTGRYAMHHGVVDWIPPTSSYGMDLNDTTIADKLKEAGYSRHAIGKWHLGFYKWAYTPTFRGFESFLGYYSGGEDYFTHITQKAYDMHRDSQPNCSESCSKNAFDLNGMYSTIAFTNEAVSVIDSHNASSPLFLYLAYQAVHAPAQAPQSYIDRYQSTIPNLKRRKYAGMVSCLDEGVGNVTQALQRNGMLDTTLIVFTTDNGGPILGGDAVGARNYPLRGGKHSVYEGGVRGTAFIRPQKNTFKVVGKRYSNLMHAADWFPTICDIANVDCTTSNPLDGVSHWDAMKLNQNITLRSEMVIGNSTDLCSNSGVECGFAYRNESWKYIRGTGGAPFSWSIPANQTGGTCNVVYGFCINGTSVANISASSVEQCCAYCELHSECNAFTLQTSICTIYSDKSEQLYSSALCTSGALDPSELNSVLWNTHDQLFDVDKDPFERNDVASENKNIVQEMDKELTKVLESYFQASDDPACPFNGWKNTANGPVMMPWC
eukprot:m.106548 g.106548  ORF g.106548 m.106548 type:complete len:584 (+) comp9155_c5_seq1:2-1753(+)